MTPIQTGVSSAETVFDDMLHDNTGQNISDKNDYYCELTALYWAWKNYQELGNPDYIGLMHYRRHFIFNDNQFPMHPKGFIVFPRLDEQYKLKCSLNDRDMMGVIEKYDLIIPYNVHVGKVYEQFKEVHDVKYYDMALEILKDKFPEYAPICDEYNDSEEFYAFCMAIYKKDIFFRYAEWIFDILFELFPKIDFRGYTTEESRIVGYIGERLTGIFFKKLFYENVAIKKLNVSFIQDTKASYIPSLSPHYNENSAVLAVSSSDEYVPYLSVFLSSVIQNASDSHNYEIIIFEHSISEVNKKLIISAFSRINIFIRFFNPESFLKGVKLHISLNYFKEECYFRLVAPIILKNYARVLFTDIDLVYNEDPWVLYQAPMQNHPIAAAHDYVWSALVNLNPKIKCYALETLELKDPYSYKNTGVMLIDIANFSWDEWVQKLLYLIDSHSYQFQEQDALNAFFQGNIMELDPNWNYVVPDAKWDDIYRAMPLESLKRMKRASLNPSIVHFSGPNKPWNRGIKKECYNIFMQYARLSPFYENILLSMLSQESSNYQGYETLLKIISEESERGIRKLRTEFEEIHFPNINRHFQIIEDELTALTTPVKKESRVKSLCYRLSSLACFLKEKREK